MGDVVYSLAHNNSNDSLQRIMAETATLLEKALADYVPESNGMDAPLYQAVRHATLGGGKRLRPFMVMQSAALFNVDRMRALRVAVAVELAHCYSLVHDDLPSMDNADLRRGKPSVHKEFGEATAILAGDGLQALAFEILAQPETHDDPNVRCALIEGLAKAMGCRGMVGGQMLDLMASTHEFNVATITRMQRMKTGALISFSCEAGAILGKASHNYRTALLGYANDLGIAFQMVDDLLDRHGSTEETGKPVGADAPAGKATFLTVMGEEEARERAALLSRQAASHLEIFEGRAAIFDDLARYLIERRY